ncbi:hypothetical protein M8C21_025247 [Ambrosia artemisiifolia]|uniref:Uncharacterized protein n=1 Tax=Ambrosia artemisiifolia TaxID=4212 RepID=A0AAD5BYS9_AMBAR|nr:hypothetical protein M8C21_025247 [Ambrosia artemisiifolia]
MSTFVNLPFCPWSVFSTTKTAWVPPWRILVLRRGKGKRFRKKRVDDFGYL